MLFKFLKITSFGYVVFAGKNWLVNVKNPETASDISLNDLVGVIFGKERPGQVRGLLFEACSTFVFKKTTTRLTSMNYASSSAPSPQVEDKVVKMETELATHKEQMNSLLAYIATRSDVPEYVAAMTRGLVSSLNTFCYSINMYILL